MELEWLLRSTFFGINTSEEAAAATTRDEMITRSEEQQQYKHEEGNRQRYYKRWRRRQPRYLLIFVALLLLLQNNVRLAEGATATTTSLLLLPITDNESARENRSATSAAADAATAASGESLSVSSALPKLAFRSRDLSSNNETTTSASSSNGNVDGRSEFTDWSDWSVCDRNCMQNRIKKCRAPSQCANSLLREERVCTDEDKTGPSCRGQKNSARRKKKRREYHIVQVNDEVRAARKGSRRKHHHHQHHRRKGKNELLQDDDGGGGHRTPQDEYGKWSKWSSCTRSCTTQRLKWCKIPGLCAKDVVRQTAYCYIEGSYCQRWIRRKIHQHYEGNSNAASGSDTSNLTEDRFADLAGDDGGSSSSSSSNSNLTPASGSATASEDYSNSSPAWKCGVARKSNKLSYFTRIIGGRPTLPGSWPWQVAVLNRYGEAFCGGTLVSPRWVLTAAHCVRKRLSVRIGEYNLLIKEGTEIELKIDHSVTHPKYNAHTVDNDIALLRLPVSLTPSETRGVACLPAPWQELPDDQLCTIIGWGKTNATHTFGTDVLHEARIPIVPDDMCRDVYVDYKITNNMFCAGYRRGRMDSCAGDSGGPLLCRNPARADHPWTIFGITSFGEGCGKRGKYGIYAKLSNYVHWINKVVRKDSFR
ncbi:coagulation factor VII [Trichogramma pretiosum]|uniref:coagulation factor VII n=1 Tax=Trichogramma pretiosum TaxID=7493 RepID=UPI0006C9D0B1|nr:coagulation factor VII [Trichogramma pretiosum]